MSSAPLSPIGVDPAPQQPIPDAIQSRLEELRNRLKTWFLVEGTARIGVWVVGIVICDLLLDRMFEMDTTQRTVMLVLMASLLGWVVYRWLLRPLTHGPTDDALCLEVEATHERLGESLISAVQFARCPPRQESGASLDLVEATIRQGASLAQEVDFSEVLNAARFRRNLLLMGVATAALVAIVLAVVFTDTWAIWFNRNVMLGNRIWPQRVYFDVEGSDAGNVVIPRGDDWPLAVQLRMHDPNEPFPDQAQLDVVGPHGWRSEPLDRLAESGRFHRVLPNVLEPFRFRVRSGKSKGEWITAQLVDRPTVTSLTLRVTDPAYTGGESRELPAGTGPYYLLPGSTLELSGTADKELSAATLSWEGGELPLIIETSQFSGEVPANQIAAATYAVSLQDQSHVWLPGQTDKGPLESRRPTRFTLKTLADRPPEIRAETSGVSGKIVPNARIPYRSLIEDETQITEVALRYVVARDGEPPADEPALEPLTELDTQLGEPSLEWETIWDLAPLALQAPARLEFYIEASDNDNVSGPNWGQSTRFLFRIVDEQELREDLLNREKLQRHEFEQLRSLQLELATETRALQASLRNEDLNEAHRTQLIQLRKRQNYVGANLDSVARRLEELVSEIINNGLDEQGGPVQQRIEQRIVQPLDDVAGNIVPEVTRHLDGTRRERQEEERATALQAAVEGQQQVLAAMDEIRKHMLESQSFQEAVNLLHQLRKTQQDVLRMTEQERDERESE